MQMQIVGIGGGATVPVMLLLRVNRFGATRQWFDGDSEWGEWIRFELVNCIECCVISK